MNHDTIKSKGDKDIPLTPAEYSALERAMQWPEDLPAWDRLNKPTNLSELSYCFRKGDEK